MHTSSLVVDEEQTPHTWRANGRVEQHFKVCSWMRMLARIPCHSYGGRGSGQASGRQDLLLRVCNTAESVSGMGYRSRNRRQVHLDFATLQGANVATI